MSIAEAERLDYRRDKAGLAQPNVFFGLKKNYFGNEIDTLVLNASMMLLFAFFGLVVLHFTLHRQLTKV